MTNDKQLAVNVFNDSNTPTQQAPEQQPTTQGETKSATPSVEQGTQTTATQQTTTSIEKANDTPTYFIYGSVIIGLFILLTLLVIIQKLNKRK